MIDMNYYRQNGGGRQRASHRFILGHLFRQKLGQTHSEKGLNVKMCVLERERKGDRESDRKAITLVRDINTVNHLQRKTLMHAKKPCMHKSFNTNTETPCRQHYSLKPVNCFQRSSISQTGFVQGQKQI